MLARPHESHLQKTQDRIAEGVQYSREHKQNKKDEMRRSMGLTGWLLCLAVFMLVVGGRATADDTCKWEAIERLFAWDTSRRVWDFHENSCGLRRWDRDSIASLLRGKSLLFLGDSTSRNVGVMLLSLLCNPDRMFFCGQMAVLPHQWPGVPHPMVCDANTSKRLTPSMAATMRENECVHDALKTRFVVLPNHTGAHHFRTRAERKEFWRLGIVPPVTVTTFKGVTVSILESGCAGRDGMHRALRYLADPAKRALLPRIDAIVVAGGMHCRYTDYKSGRWYRAIAPLLGALVRSVSPVVWLEMPHCEKHYGQRMALTKVVDCGFAAAHAERVNTAFRAQGVLVSPTRFMTKHTRQTGDKHNPPTELERNVSCLLVDPIHPSAWCYADMLQVHLHALSYAWKTAAAKSPVTTVARGAAEGGAGASESHTNVGASPGSSGESEPIASMSTDSDSNDGFLGSSAVLYVFLVAPLAVAARLFGRRRQRGPPNSTE